ncbi:Alpha/Beta hydrolase protein [Tuber borchii]|uniref:Alpha/Beta hydrolase protein n=1 Tax=Tuber borchii TaxID=42251 RepID=A0A2T6ZCW2_TUBBO|nr:Alpha/Beta hydrolase protein [Tuber borchii]
MVESYPAEIDCTSHGPMCPQSIFDEEGFFFRIPENQRKRAAADLTQDEFECLNLVITVPSSILNSPDSEEILPVFVNIHRGANKWISSSVPLLDMANFVKKSMDIGKPIVAVGINYRLNIFGYGVLPGGLGANNGLLDQRLALKVGAEAHPWLPRQFKDGYFRFQGVVQSWDYAEWNVERLRPQRQSLGIDLSKEIAKNLGADVEKEGLEEVLKAAPAQDVVGAIEKGGFDFSQYTDDEGFSRGGGGRQGSVYAPRIPLVPPENMIAAFRSPGATGEALLSTYQIPTSTPPSPVPAVTKRVHDRTLQFLSDILVSFPNPTSLQPGAARTSRRNYIFPEETHQAMSKVQAAMQEHFISSIRGDVLFEAAEGEGMKYGPVGKVAAGWKKDSRNVRLGRIWKG